MFTNNKGFDKNEIAEFQKKLAAENGLYLINKDEDNSEEYVNFFFLGKFQGRDVIYDSVIYTLRLHHQSEMYELAEHEAAKRFPEFKKIQYEEDEFGDMKALDDLEEEIGLFMSEQMMEMEEEGAVRVAEFLEIDPNLSYGIGLDVALNVEVVTDKVIKKFIKEYNEDILKLDETHYTFQTEDIED